MAYQSPLPQGMHRLLDSVTHPGLLLDKYGATYDPTGNPGGFSEKVQKPLLERVATLTRQAPSGAEFEQWSARRAAALDQLHATTFRAVSAGPLTLHLARASALENAGICLHPIYGFVYLPGSSLKGMARAYAETVWKPSQADDVAAQKAIEAVLGNKPGEPKSELQKAGSVVVHDAWPEKWPPLIVDILNNHHAHYYQKGDPPGDWDSPVPVYFLTTTPGISFSFAVAKRRDDVADALLDRAVEWLAGALTHLGAGAKTATGYGGFKLEAPLASKVDESWKVAQDKNVRARKTFDLELVTPAFLAGANQQASDCDLRPATLRGLLRWWWRTMHAGFVDVPTLASMEAALWGDTASGSAIRITVQPVSSIEPLRFDKNGVQTQNRLPKPPNSKTTQGLWYHSFGMDDNKSEGGVRGRFQRWYLAPGACWQVQLTARSVKVGESFNRVEAQIVLDQGLAALALLYRYGGVGAKSRKGFGSFAGSADLAAMSLEDCRQRAVNFRRAFGLGAASFDAGRAHSSNIEDMLPWTDLPVGWSNYWLALDQVGDAAQRFAQRYKHRREKKALGLPRKIGHPASGDFRQGRYVDDRHTSPVHYHFAREDGVLVLRVAAFPAKYLPDLPTSRRFLGELLEHLREELPRRFKDLADEGAKPPINPDPPRAAAGSAATPATRALPRSGDRVQALLLPEKTKRGGWTARHVASGMTGPIVNSPDVPGDQQPNVEVPLIVASVNTQAISFRFPTAADAAKPVSAPKKPQDKSPPQRRK